MENYRTARYTLEEVRIPDGALWGKQTQRALNNFKISKITFPSCFISNLALLKKASCCANMELGLIDKKRGNAIKKAADDIYRNEYHDQFPLDIFQTGSGTSTNMNANEVIANLANKLLENSKLNVHANDHVNKCQSSNDVIPTVIHITVYEQTIKKLIPALKLLQGSFRKKADEYKNVVKTGRTHLMDAMPMTFAQEIFGWEGQIAASVDRLLDSLSPLLKLALGGTAVGTGVNAHPEFAQRAIQIILEHSGFLFQETDNHFFAQSCLDNVVELSGQLKTTASGLLKIANDLRWLNSGPIGGIGEIKLPTLQEGSSIMPGKVNPAICESVMMVCSQVMGNDVTVSIANSHGNFQLLVMLPVIAYNVLNSIEILSNAITTLAKKCVKDLKVIREKMEESIEKNPILVTLIAPVIGYEKAAIIAKKAYVEDRNIRDVIIEMTRLNGEQLDKIFDPIKMTRAGIIK